LETAGKQADLVDGFFRQRRNYYLGSFPVCLDPAHSEPILACFILACEQVRA
jgi:hypothetical protein